MDIFIFLLIVVGTIGTGVYLGLNIIKNRKIFKEEYDQALRGKDKRAALIAGRKYYASLRKGNQLTIYDEQAISNDINTMM